MTANEIFAWFVPPALLVLIGWLGAALHLRSVRKEREAERDKH